MRALRQVRDEDVAHDAPLKLWHQNSDLTKDEEVMFFCLKLENGLSSHAEQRTPKFEDPLPQPPSGSPPHNTRISVTPLTVTPPPPCERAPGGTPG